jgi:hypothetical protein
MRPLCRRERQGGLRDRRDVGDRQITLKIAVKVTYASMRLAAQLWADARRRGRPTAGERAIDVDIILAAQARLIGERGQPDIVATTNVKHLSQFVAAENWETISPD